MYLIINETNFPWDLLVMLEFADTQAKSSCGIIGCCVTWAAEAVQPHWLSLNLYYAEYLNSRFVKGHRLILSLLKVFLRLNGKKTQTLHNASI